LSYIFILRKFSASDNLYLKLFNLSSCYKNCKKKFFCARDTDTWYRNEIQYLHGVQIWIPNVQQWWQIIASSQVTASCWHVTNRSLKVWYLQFRMFYICIVINYRLPSYEQVHILLSNSFFLMWFFTDQVIW
jgi:hypothetical protein